MTGTEPTVQPASNPGPDAVDRHGRRHTGASAALRFVLLVGAMSFFADFAYEGMRSVVGPYLGLLGAGALVISMVGGFGELVGYALRLLSGPGADRTGRYWPIAIGGYVLQMSVIPLLALAGSWQVAALLVILERAGKAIRNPPRDAMLSHAGEEIGHGWAFGLHEGLDQAGATLGPLAVALVLVLRHDDYKLAFALLAIPAMLTLIGLAVARLSYPQPELLHATHARLDSVKGTSRTFWIYLAAAALIGAGFADFPLIAYHFEQQRVVSAAVVPVFYAVAMASAGAGSLLFGRLFDRYGMRLLPPLALLTVLYAPLTFLGGLRAGLAGVVLWGIGTGVQESIVPAAVRPMIDPARRASAFGVFTGGYGIAWFLGSTAIGLLYGISLHALAAFSIVTTLAALPLLVAAQRPTAHRR